jgi:hypothetical protein
MDSLSIDICSFAAYTALQCTVIPRTDVYLGESGLPEDFEVSGDICDAASLAGLITVGAPLCITTSKVKRTFPTSLHFTFPFTSFHLTSPNFTSILTWTFQDRRWNFASGLHWWRGRMLPLHTHHCCCSKWPALWHVETRRGLPNIVGDAAVSKGAVAFNIVNILLQCFCGCDTIPIMCLCLTKQRSIYMPLGRISGGRFFVSAAQRSWQLHSTGRYYAPWHAPDQTWTVGLVC